MYTVHVQNNLWSSALIMARTERKLMISRSEKGASSLSHMQSERESPGPLEDLLGCRVFIPG